MGGVRRNENFRLNCDGWAVCRKHAPQTVQAFMEAVREAGNFAPVLRNAPVTGAVENIGFMDETSFYYQMISAAYQAGLRLCIGDGTPDIKLQSGIAAVHALREQTNRTAGDAQALPMAAVFIKPYDNERILQRAAWASPVAEVIGVDIDAYNIATMRNVVRLERKTAAQLKALKAQVGVPFAIKGVFCTEDLALVREVKPDIAYISNHGGRVETRIGSTAEFLLQYGAELRANCGELWVDGGIRSACDVATALSLGATQVLVGRPLITALCKGGGAAVADVAAALRTL